VATVGSVYLYAWQVCMTKHTPFSGMMVVPKGCS